MKNVDTTIHFVKEPHPATLCANKPPIGRLMYRCAVFLSASDHQMPKAVVAYHKGRIVGILKYRTRYKTLHTAGTMVDRRFRGKGIATKMWKALLKRERPHTVDVPISTNDGMKLIKKIRSQHKDVMFVIHDYIS